ncbi:MAG TPA: hypothetical protein VF746_12850 [Longimicrobium sp.]|jgi:hypothetical protein
MRTTAILRRGLFAAGLAATLGFGAVQALASPARADAGFRGCTQDSCEKKCQTQYGVSGFCEGRGCRCFI